MSKSDVQERAAIKATTERILDIRNAMLITRHSQVDMLRFAIEEHERKDKLQEREIELLQDNVDALHDLYNKQDKKLDRRRFWGRTGWIVAGALGVVLIAR